MSLPTPCKLADEMIMNEAKMAKQYELEQLISSSGGMSLEHPVVISEVNGVKHQNLKVKSLESAQQADGDLSRARF